jgi:1-aminocyclopropane-1-carboxylate deaminase
MLAIDPTPTEILRSAFLDKKGIRVMVKRDDLTHPLIMGNKWRKLKYNLHHAIANEYETIITYGGAFSNHIHATAAAVNAVGLKSIGIIRGEELHADANPTLMQASSLGMQLIFVSREEFRNVKNDLSLPASLANDSHAKNYFLPEGGTNALAVKGCKEILKEIDESYDICCTAMGTGGTFLGLLGSLPTHKKLFGFSALKGRWIQQEVNRLKQVYDISGDNYQVFEDDFFKGYGRFDQNLMQFILDFSQEYNILLDPIYTGKMFFRVWDMIKNDQIARGTILLLIHTGGLQGIRGFNFLHGLKLPEPH